MNQRSITLDELKNIFASEASQSHTSTKPTKPNLEDKKFEHEAWLKRKAQIKDLRKLLHETYPEIFDYQNPKPLSIGIHKDIKAAFPQFSQKLIRDFLATWVKDTRYLRSLSSTSHRFNLYNEAIADVKPLHKEFASSRLKTSKK